MADGNAFLEIMEFIISHAQNKEGDKKNYVKAIKSETNVTPRYN
jgi:hypothetical protein